MFSSASSSCFVREFRLAPDICLSIANGEDVDARLCVSVLLYEGRMIMQQNHAALYCRLSVDDGYSGTSFQRPAFQQVEIFYRFIGKFDSSSKAEKTA